MIAELTAFGKGKAWPFTERSETEQQIDHYVQRIDAYRKQMSMWVGVPVCPAERKWIQEIAAEGLSAYRKVQQCERALESLAGDHQGIQQLSSLGIVTMCVLWSVVGDPRDYDSAGAYLKAFGLNLKERSSGKRVGQLAITKRGPSLARRWLFFAALRAVQRPEVKPWYLALQARDPKHGKMKGLVGVMRKLCRSIWHVSQTGETFAWEKVFPGEPLLATSDDCQQSGSAGVPVPLLFCS